MQEGKPDMGPWAFMTDGSCERVLPAERGELRCPSCGLRPRMEQVDDSWGPEYTELCGPCHVLRLVGEKLDLRNRLAAAEGKANSFEQQAQVAVRLYREEMERLEGALKNLLDHYVAFVESGDCGHWNPEDEPVVQQARKALGGG